VRFARFNLVGLVGFGVQVAVLSALAAAGWPAAAGTAVAVEAAVLHNFVWHERWTWADRREGTTAARLLRFHLSNGLVSIAGNVLLTASLAAAGVPVVAANAIAVAACAAANFVFAERFVFARAAP
jgi:putative flippase GtrA